MPAFVRRVKAYARRFARTSMGIGHRRQNSPALCCLELPESKLVRRNAQAAERTPCLLFAVRMGTTGSVFSTSNCFLRSHARHPPAPLVLCGAVRCFTS